MVTRRHARLVGERAPTGGWVAYRGPNGRQRWIKAADLRPAKEGLPSTWLRVSPVGLATLTAAYRLIPVLLSQPLRDVIAPPPEG
jgi:hypothetical protein